MYIYILPIDYEVLIHDNQLRAICSYSSFGHLLINILLKFILIPRDGIDDFSKIPKQSVKRLEYAGTGKAGFSSLILVFWYLRKTTKQFWFFMNDPSEIFCFSHRNERFQIKCNSLWNLYVRIYERRTQRNFGFVSEVPILTRLVLTDSTKQSTVIGNYFDPK